jgi:hypothetical protein
MLIEVRGGASWRFSAPQSPIGCSLSPPALLCLEPSPRRRRRLSRPRAARSRPFDPAAARVSCPFVYPHG